MSRTPNQINEVIETKTTHLHNSHETSSSNYNSGIPKNKNDQLNSSYVTNGNDNFDISIDNVNEYEKPDHDTGDINTKIKTDSNTEIVNKNKKSTASAKNTSSAKNEKLNIALLNIRSIRNKLNELEMFVDDLNKKPHIIIITETWLREDELKIFNLKNYQTIGNCRTIQRGGGILFFIRDTIRFKIIRNEQYCKSHLLLINLNDFNMKIAGFYRSPATKPEVFLDILENTLGKNENLLCLGDVNFDILKKDDTNVKHYIDILENNNYSILNKIDEKNHTYHEIKNNKKHTSILDHIFSDNFQNRDDYNFETIDVCFSDHRMLLFECNLGSKKIEVQQKKKS